MSQHNHLLALCNKILRLELNNDVLHFNRLTKELCDLFTPLPNSGKGTFGMLGTVQRTFSERVFKKDGISPVLMLW